MLVFEFKGVTASGWGWRGRGGCGRGREGLCLWRLRGVRSCGSGGYCCNLIRCHVLHLGGRCFGAFESVWVKDGLSLLGWFIDGERRDGCDWAGVIWCHQHTPYHHFGPCAPAVLFLQGGFHVDTVRGQNRLKGQRGRALYIWTALLESTGPIAASPQVRHRPKTGGMKGTCGERLAYVAIHLIRFTSDLPPLPRDAARAGASKVRAEDVGLCRAVVFEVAAVPGVDLWQVNAPVGLLWWFTQTLVDVLARCAVREKLWGEKTKSEEQLYNDRSENFLKIQSANSANNVAKPRCGTHRTGIPSWAKD